MHLDQRPVIISLGPPSLLIERPVFGSNGLPVDNQSPGMRSTPPRTERYLQPEWFSDEEPTLQSHILERTPRTPEEGVPRTTLPFVSVLALLVFVVLGALRIRRAVQNFKSEAVIRWLREVRASRQSREEMARVNEWRRSELRWACCSFDAAAAKHNGHKDISFHSTGECMALIPALVEARLLEVKNARLLECNTRFLAVVGGSLRIKADEQARVDYLDSVAGPAFVAATAKMDRQSDCSRN